MFTRGKTIYQGADVFKIKPTKYLTLDNLFVDQLVTIPSSVRVLEINTPSDCNPFTTAAAKIPETYFNNVKYLIFNRPVQARFGLTPDFKFYKHPNPLRYLTVADMYNAEFSGMTLDRLLYAQESQEYEYQNWIKWVSVSQPMPDVNYKLYYYIPAGVFVKHSEEQ